MSEYPDIYFSNLPTYLPLVRHRIPRYSWHHDAS